MALCTIEGCGREHDSNGYCSAHWQRWYIGDRGERLTRPFRIYERHKGNCGVHNCDRRKRTRGFCEVHYRRYREGDRGDRLERPIRRRRSKGNGKQKEHDANATLDRALSALDF